MILVYDILIEQNFFVKAAQIIIQSRITVNPTYQRGTTLKRTNKWVNISERAMV